MRRRVAVVSLLVAGMASLTGCGGSPAIKEQAPSVSATPSVTASTIAPTAESEIIEPGPAPADSVIFHGQGFEIAVPKGWQHDRDSDMDSFLDHSSAQELDVVKRRETSVAEAVAEYNAEDPATAITFHGVRWMGTLDAAYGERTFTGGDADGIHTAILIAQLPDKRVIMIAANAPAEEFEDSIVLACLDSFNPAA